MEHLDTATGRFQGIQQKILYPNNAVLVVAGDLKKLLPKNGKILWPNQKGKKLKNKISLKNQ
jgi:hypothetical protein